jgi:hypothetical protein
MIDLMMYVILPATIVLSASLYALHHLRMKEKMRKQDEIAKKVRDVKAAYRTTLEMFSMQRVIRPAHVSNYYDIIDNYFVNQPLTEENADKMERLANRIAITISKEINLASDKSDTEWLKKKLLNFAVMLPSRTREFDKVFYQSRIKELLRNLSCTKAGFIQRHARAA